MHAIALHYPVHADHDKRLAMFNMLQSIGGIIPCGTCRTHYNQWFTKRVHLDGDVLHGQSSLFNALVNFHNEVNRRKSKAEVSTEAAHAIHGKFASGSMSMCPAPKPHYIELISTVADRGIAILGILICIVAGIALARGRSTNTLAKKPYPH